MSSQPTASLTRRLARIGASIGAAIPVSLACLIFLEIYLRPPPQPGQAYCGMPGLGACFLVMIAPVASLVMAGIGWFVGVFIMWTGLRLPTGTNHEDTACQIQ